MLLGINPANFRLPVGIIAVVAADSGRWRRNRPPGIRLREARAVLVGGGLAPVRGRDAYGGARRVAEWPAVHRGRAWLAAT